MVCLHSESVAFKQPASLPPSTSLSTTRLAKTRRYLPALNNLTFFICFLKTFSFWHCNHLLWRCGSVCVVYVHEVCICVCEGRRPLSSSVTPPLPLSRSQPASLDRTNLARLSGQQAQGVVLSLPPQHRDGTWLPSPWSMCVQGTWTQVLRAVLKHVPYGALSPTLQLLLRGM